MALRFRGYFFELINIDEVDSVINAIYQTAAGGNLSNKDCSKRAITNPDSITVVCKDKDNVLASYETKKFGKHQLANNLRFI